MVWTEEDVLNDVNRMLAMAERLRFTLPIQLRGPNYDMPGVIPMKAFILMTGTTGAGKTTHGRLLAAKIGAGYVSSGDIAREFMDAETSLLFHEGKLSPHEDKIRDRIGLIVNSNRVVVFDGFPRGDDQLSWLSANWRAAMYKVQLAWAMHVLVPRWMARCRNEHDTLKAFVLRDELYHKETKPMLDVIPGFEWSGGAESDVMMLNTRIREKVCGWLASVCPEFIIVDSPKQRAIDLFMHEHYLQLWRPDHGSTWEVGRDYIEKRLWDIVNA